MGSWKNLKVTEWMRRDGPDRIVYRFQIDDPDTWDKPWSGEGVFNAMKTGGVYEYACHEGNYALYNVLAGARARDHGTAAGAPVAAPAKPAGS